LHGARRRCQKVIKSFSKWCWIPRGALHTLDLWAAMRGFRNPNDHALVIYSVVGGTDEEVGRIEWHPEVLKAAEGTGLQYDETGYLKNEAQASTARSLSYKQCQRQLTYAGGEAPNERIRSRNTSGAHAARSRHRL
jgi:hypothetical protein